MNNKRLLILIALIMLIGYGNSDDSFAQSADIPGLDTDTDMTRLASETYFIIYLSLGVLLFGLILVSLLILIVFKKNVGWTQDISRAFTLSVIVTSGLFLITAGYTSQQIAPMFGLLGTIAGYLLGKSSNQEQGPKS